MFVLVYAKQLGCRWYNTETGQIGGQWGPQGVATSSLVPYKRHHASLTKGGDYVRISKAGDDFDYFWEVGTLNVTACDRTVFHCAGYKTQGYSTFVHDPGLVDEMDTWKRQIGNPNEYIQLVVPVEKPRQFGINQHLTWNNADPGDSAPVCMSTHRYDSGGVIDRVWDAEILCMETDRLASTVWRFAHNRATSTYYEFQTQPLGTVSQDGRFFLFTSDWDGQVGQTDDGETRSDVWIVALR